jgi:hypothetical protein
MTPRIFAEILGLVAAASVITVWGAGHEQVVALLNLSCDSRVNSGESAKIPK